MEMRDIWCLENKDFVLVYTKNKPRIFSYTLLSLFERRWKISCMGVFTICVLLNPSTMSRKQDNVNFLRSQCGLNLEFYFFLTGSHVKVKEPRLPYYLPIGRKRVR